MTDMYDPRLCYILDGFLLFYGLTITGMYIREKFFKSDKPENDDGISSDLKRDTERGQAFKAEGEYQSLKPRPAGDEYIKLPAKKERRRKTNDQVDQVYQDLSLATKDTYDSLQMQPLPRPPR